jgi:hypothetical protein
MLRFSRLAIVTFAAVMLAVVASAAAGSVGKPIANGIYKWCAKASCRGSKVIAYVEPNGNRISFSGNFAVAPKRCDLVPEPSDLSGRSARIRNGKFTFNVYNSPHRKDKTETYRGTFTSATRIRLTQTRLGTKFTSSGKCSVSGSVVLKYRRQAPKTPPGPSG